MSVNLTVQEQKTSVNLTVQEEGQDITLNLEPVLQDVNIQVDPIGIEGSRGEKGADGEKGEKGDKGDAGYAVDYNFEALSQNLNNYNYEIVKTNGVISSVIYSSPEGNITKAINRAEDGSVANIQLSGGMLEDINKFKTLIRDEQGVITNVVYSEEEYAPFIATIETTSNNETFTFNLFPDYELRVNTTNHPNIPSGEYNLVDLIAPTNATIDWGDGIIENVTRAERQLQNNVSFTDVIEHEYAVAGEYTITISGDFPIINIKQEPALKSVTQVGKTKLQFMRFHNCQNFLSFIAGGSKCDTSRVKSMHEMFRSCEYITTLNLNGFDTSNVIDMQSMFSNAFRVLNIDISTFNTSNVWNFDYMFYNMSFNENTGEHIEASTILNYLDTSSATGLNSTFYFQRWANFDVSNLNTSNVNTISRCFYGITSDSNLTGMHLWDVRNLSFGSLIVWNNGTLGTAKLDLIYINWGAQTFIGDPSTRYGLSFATTQYTPTPEVLAGRQSLIDQGFSITDGGPI